MYTYKHTQNSILISFVYLSFCNSFLLVSALFYNYLISKLKINMPLDIYYLFGNSMHERFFKKILVVVFWLGFLDLDK